MRCAREWPAVMRSLSATADNQLVIDLFGRRVLVVALGRHLAGSQSVYPAPLCTLRRAIGFRDSATKPPQVAERTSFFFCSLAQRTSP